MSNIQPIAPKSRTNSSRKKVVPLIVEPHPVEYSGFPFITLIQYRKLPMLVIVDNADDDIIRAFVLDWCGPEGINEEILFDIASYWYENKRNCYPISIEFSLRGLTTETSKIYRALNTEFVSRVIGPISKYPMACIKSIKRRRKKALPTGVEVVESLTMEHTFK
jgi:hypothetical protein